MPTGPNLAIFAAWELAEPVATMVMVVSEPLWWIFCKVIMQILPLEMTIVHTVHDDEYDLLYNTNTWQSVLYFHAPVILIFFVNNNLKEKYSF